MNSYGEKIEETEEFLIYEYSAHETGATIGFFKYYKTSELQVDMIKNCFTGGTEIGWAAGHLIVKIKKFFSENGYYPDKISYCSG